MSVEPIVNFSIDDLFQTTSIGSLDKAIGNNLYGINHRQVASAVPGNKELHGLVFFTRPQLNMQSDNIRSHRSFTPLLTREAYSIQRFIRTMLDPRLGAGFSFMKREYPALVSPLVDNQNAFIPILTNNLTSISGWPDPVLPFNVSKPGLINETQSIADGVLQNRGSFSLTASFRNSRGDPIVFLMYIWAMYISAVVQGQLMPYMDMITDNRLDYNTRIYRVTLDPTRTYVRKIAATGAAFPVNNPIGSYFDYNNERPYNDQNKDISFQFQCDGVDYFDDILIYEFNKTVQIFNPSMADNSRNNDMVKLTPNLLSFFNHRGYPRINEQTNELEWWVSKQMYNTRVSAFESQETVNA